MNGPNGPNGSERDRLLGFAAIAPPAALKAGARFQSQADYRAFLERTATDPRAHWRELAGRLHWHEPFGELGGPGDWFPGGRLNLTVSCLDAWIETDLGGAEALIALDGQSRTEFNRRELLSRVASVCDRLRGLDLAVGDRVLLALPRGYELLCAVLAALRLGLVCVPLDPGPGDPGRLARRAGDAACRAALTTRGVIEDGLVRDFDRLPVERRAVLEPDWERDAFASPAPVPVGPMHPAFVLADAGGRVFSLPTAGVALHGLSAYRYLLDGRGPGDLHWFQTPAHHASFLSGALGALIDGGRIVAPLTGEFGTSQRLLAAFEQVAPRVVIIQAKILDQVVRGCQEQQAAGPCGRGPELLAIEGHSVSPTFFRFVRNGLFDGRTHVFQVLGRPEASGLVAGPHPPVSPVRPASAGRPAPGLALSVIDTRGQPCRPNHPGTLALTRVPPGLAVELQGAAPPVPLGVRARMDPAGRVWPIGEAKLELPDEVRIPSTEVEALIASLPGVRAAAVVVVREPGGAAHSRAFVQSDAGPELFESIRRAVAERFGPRAVPGAIQRVSALPYSRTGKLLRSVLRRIAQGDTEGLDDLGLVTDRDLLAELVRGRGAPGKEG